MRESNNSKIENNIKNDKKQKGVRSENDKKSRKVELEKAKKSKEDNLDNLRKLKELRVEKNKKYKVEIIDMASTGSGVAKIGDMAVFVDGGLVGDILDIKIDLVKKKYANGRIIKLVSPSKDRVKRLCSEDLRLCGGCQIQELDYRKQLEIKENSVRQAMARIGNVENIDDILSPIIGMDNPFFYRNKGQYPVKKEDGKLKIGFYKKKTHEVMDTDLCVIQDKVNEEIIKLLRKIIDEENISVYDEKVKKGVLRHIIIRIGDIENADDIKDNDIKDTEDIYGVKMNENINSVKEKMVVLVCNESKSKIEDKVLKKIDEELKKNIPGFKTLVVNINNKHTNVILGHQNRIISGTGEIRGRIGDIVFSISPQSFFQVNPVQTEVLYKKALEYANLSGNEEVFDIYCGIGTISLFLARNAKKVVGIEIVEQAIIDAKKNAKINGMKNTEFFVGKAEEVVPKLYSENKTADVVIVDPPRKGCDDRVLDTIVKMEAKKLVYVSCNPSTLARDVKYLSEFDFVVKKVQPVDLFPHSMHVECVVLLTKTHN